MSKLLSTLLAAAFAAVAMTPVAFAAEKADAALAKACKGKEAGKEVTVDGKKVKCPAAKK
jgi:Ni/Co efflux regulator RcnB